jgi:hypothetical protein
MAVLDDMIHVLERVAKVNKAVTIPYLEGKYKLKIVDKGADHGQIVTGADLSVSKALLDGPEGLRAQFPGSFSEESDCKERLSALDIYQVDPLDGTGDMVDTYQTPKPVGPTTLVSRLQREAVDRQFSAVGGLIYDVLSGMALVSDTKTVLLFNAKDHLIEVPYEQTEPAWKGRDQVVRINRRISYPQLTFDGPFMEYLRKNGFKIEQVPIGGAGTAAMQLFRNYIQPRADSGKAFTDLKPIDILFNAQPDWKTWDTDGTEVIADALKLPVCATNIYGTDRLGDKGANACYPTLEEMHHKRGYVRSISRELHVAFTQDAKEFQQANPDCPLLQKDYKYKDAIVARALGK